MRPRRFRRIGDGEGLTLAAWHNARVRLRTQKRLGKLMRRSEHKSLELAKLVRLRQIPNCSLAAVLNAISTDASAGWFIRGSAATLLVRAGEASIINTLLTQFRNQRSKEDLWETALTMERLGDLRLVPPLRMALRDANPERRHAAARALGWIPRSGRRAELALRRVIVDPDQPHEVREEAAESLAYCGSHRSIGALLSTLREADVRLRFWAVFALGNICQRLHGNESARSAGVAGLESMLADSEVPPGNWWPVRREALAALGSIVPQLKNYHARLLGEIQAILADPNATPEDRRWAEFYG